MFKLLICMLLPLAPVGTSCAPAASVTSTASYSNYEGKTVPYTKITNHTIRLTKCDSGMCTLFTSVSLDVFNPLMWAVKARVDCIYKLRGKPFDKFVGPWFSLAAKTKAKLAPIDHMMVAILDGPTPVTISCGITWHEAAMVNAFMGMGKKNITALRTNYAKSVTRTVIPSASK